MHISISQAAIEWFKDEVELTAGMKVKFFAKIYGTSPIQPGFALGFTVDNTPINKAVHTIVEGIEFYVEEGDVWFFNGHNLHVDYDEAIDELVFAYPE